MIKITYLLTMFGGLLSRYKVTQKSDLEQAVTNKSRIDIMEAGCYVGQGCSTFFSRVLHIPYCPHILYGILNNPRVSHILPWVHAYSQWYPPYISYCSLNPHNILIKFQKDLFGKNLVHLSNFWKNHSEEFLLKYHKI